MTLIRPFRATIQARLQREPEFRAALLREVANCRTAGNVSVARVLLRDLRESGSQQNRPHPGQINHRERRTSDP